VEEAEEDWVYHIWPWEHHERGKMEGEGGWHDLRAMTEDNMRLLFLSIEWGR